MQISEKQLRAAVLAYHGDDFFDCFEEGSEFANEKVEAIRAALEAALSAQVQDVAAKKLEIAVNAMMSTIMSGSIWKLEEALEEIGIVDLLAAAPAEQEG